MELFTLGVRFTIDDDVPPQRNALHSALEHLRSFTVAAHSFEEAEMYADLVRVALIAQADQ